MCKHERFGKLIEMAAREGISEVVEGSQLDDASDYRPGTEAARELSVSSPLVDIGFYKYEVRALSRELGLSTWNMRASSCLATRIPYGEEVTREKLSVIDQARAVPARPRAGPGARSLRGGQDSADRGGPGLRASTGLGRNS